VCHGCFPKKMKRSQLEVQLCLGLRSLVGYFVRCVMVERDLTKWGCCHLQGGDSGLCGPEIPQEIWPRQHPLACRVVWFRRPSGVRTETFVSGQRFRPDVLKLETLAPGAGDSDPWLPGQPRIWCCPAQTPVRIWAGVFGLRPKTPVLWSLRTKTRPSK
jgi:hypothetical protein